ncbi:hypothetical protein MOE86_15455 [Bacillus atrophaeus]|uniref:hypothetical protein n=1 Tax=Bacillus atrophaeus TaxID=1452 RepID=UPI002280A1AB|nr:hypothetical protein [Bacillus atrophaeus]MCY9198074.1 hypothetical protein [Bacillus atrophaeus]
MKDILVNKPQFDVDTLSPGTAVCVNTRSYNFLNLTAHKDFNAIVCKASPLELKIVFVSNEEHYTETLSIKDVVNGHLTITLLEKVKSKEETK